MVSSAVYIAGEATTFIRVQKWEICDIRSIPECFLFAFYLCKIQNADENIHDIFLILLFNVPVLLAVILVYDAFLPEIDGWLQKSYHIFKSHVLARQGVITF